MGKIMEKMKEIAMENEIEALKELKLRLERSLELMQSGKEGEGNASIEEINRWMEDILMEYKEKTDNENESRIERSSLPRAGEVVAEGNKIDLRVIREEEKDKYIALSYEYSFTKRLFEREEYVASVWEDYLSETTFVCSIYGKETNEFLGYCSIRDLTRNELEVAIELMPEHCHKGYGTEALSLLLERMCLLTGRKYYRARVAIDNHESQGLMKKLGATPNGISEFLLHGDAIEEFKEENKGEITEEIRAVAAEFGMEAEDILGYVLEYRFDMDKN